MKKYTDCKFITILCRKKCFANIFTANYLRRSFKREKIHLYKYWKSYISTPLFFKLNMVVYIIDKNGKDEIMI